MPTASMQCKTPDVADICSRGPRDSSLSLSDSLSCNALGRRWRNDRAESSLLIPLLVPLLLPARRSSSSSLNGPRRRDERGAGGESRSSSSSSLSKFNERTPAVSARLSSFRAPRGDVPAEHGETSHVNNNNRVSRVTNVALDRIKPDIIDK